MKSIRVQAWEIIAVLPFRNELERWAKLTNADHMLLDVLRTGVGVTLRDLDRLRVMVERLEGEAA